MRRALFAAVVIVVLLVAAGPAAARTYTIWAGEKAFPAPAPAPPTTVLNDFFPRAISIHRGDRVKIKNFGFHTATILGNQKLEDNSLIGPDPASGTYGTPNPNLPGQTWYFEGLPKFVYNLLVFATSESGVVENRNTFVNSGAALFGPDDTTPGSFTFTFPKVGSYTILCLVHPNMTLKVNVKPTLAAALTPKQVNQKAALQYAASYQKAAALGLTVPPPNTIYTGVGDRATLFQFFPSTLTVPADTIVTFESKSGSEVHNALFGEDFSEEGALAQFIFGNDLFPNNPGDPNQMHPFYIYGSDPPDAVGITTFVGAAQHGAGVFATPLLANSAKMPLPNIARVRFTTPGTYHYICQLHGPDMSGTVVVTPTLG